MGQTDHRGEAGQTVQTHQSAQAHPEPAHLPDLAAAGSDLLLVTDDQFHVTNVVVAPPGLHVREAALLDIAGQADRTALRSAVELSLAHGRAESVAIHLAHSREHLYLATVEPVPRGLGAILCRATRVPTTAVAAITNEVSDRVRVLETLLDMVPSGVFWKDRESRFLGANRAVLDSVGLANVNELVGTTDNDHFPEEQARLFRSIDVQVMTDGAPVEDFAEPLTRTDGRLERLHTTKHALRNRDGEIEGVLGVFQFVTEETRVADALRESERRYSLAARATRDGIFEFDPNTMQFLLTERCCDLLELRFTNEPVPLRTVADRFHSKTARERRKRGYKPFDNPDSRVTNTEPIKLADGSTRWLQIVAAPLFDGDTLSHVVGAMADITVDVERELDLLHRATHDDLTGLANRSSLTDRVEGLLANGTTASMLYLDLDQFKVINDSLGHQAGDEMLAQVAERLKGVCGPERYLSRLGGDEFAVLWPEANPDRTAGFADEIIRDIRAPISLDGIEMYSTASVGVVHINSHYTSAADVLRDADIALYQAKADGKNCWRLFNPEMREAVDAELAAQNRIRRAVQAMEFNLHYQPIFDGATNQLAGFEALIRWTTSDGGTVAPDHFLPYLEKTGLILDVGEWVLGEACNQLARWQRDHPAARGVSMAINMSRVQFRSDRLAETVHNAIATSGLDPSDIVLEVTETAVSDMPEQLEATLEAIRSLGIRIAVDDFGVGQSSLATLHALPIDILKIDRAIVQRIGFGDGAPVAAAVLNMARPLGLATVAEGVETQAQMNWLVRHGCDEIQGFLLGRPVAAEDAAKLL
jgi:diguanylate cyclase (GGDEF)-like protein/PAS domain S-box-containing protein